MDTDRSRLTTERGLFEDSWETGSAGNNDRDHGVSESSGKVESSTLVGKEDGEIGTLPGTNCDECVKLRHRVGYWLTEKKTKRLNFHAFQEICRDAGIDLIKLRFDRPLEEQGPFSVIIHKLTDQIARTAEGSEQSLNQIDLLQAYLSSHPETVMIDPISNVMRLLDRHQQYLTVKDCDVVDAHYFIPSFVEFSTPDIEENKRRMKENDVQYPFVCKPILSHCQQSMTSATVGSPTDQIQSLCHPPPPAVFFPLPHSVSTVGGSADREEMAIVFNERGLRDIDTPCIAQTFINHNARLFKIFVIGGKSYVLTRPSIKNFYPADQETIFFNSNDVSKSNSSSILNILDEHDDRLGLPPPIIDPDNSKMFHLVSGLQKKFGMDLLGIDVIIENYTGRYGVIDINAFPGYDGVSEFFPSLLELIKEKVRQSESYLLRQTGHSQDMPFAESSGTHRVSTMTTTVGWYTEKCDYEGMNMLPSRCNRQEWEQEQNVDRISEMKNRNKEHCRTESRSLESFQELNSTGNGINGTSTCTTVRDREPEKSSPEMLQFDWSKFADGRRDNEINRAVSGSPIKRRSSYETPPTSDESPPPTKWYGYDDESKRSGHKEPELRTDKTGGATEKAGLCSTPGSISTPAAVVGPPTCYDDGACFF